MEITSKTPLAEIRRSLLSKVLHLLRVVYNAKPSDKLTTNEFYAILQKKIFEHFSGTVDQGGDTKDNLHDVIISLIRDGYIVPAVGNSYIGIPCPGESNEDYLAHCLHRAFPKYQRTFVLHVWQIIYNNYSFEFANEEDYLHKLKIVGRVYQMEHESEVSYMDAFPDTLEEALREQLIEGRDPCEFAAELCEVLGGLMDIAENHKAGVNIESAFDDREMTDDECEELSHELFGVTNPE
jgi:hypothetical protein